MKLNIPSIGDRLTLTKPWKLHLMYERRNKKAWEEWFGPYEPVVYNGAAYLFDNNGVVLRYSHHFHEDNIPLQQEAQKRFEKFSNNKDLRAEGNNVWITHTLPKGSVLTVDRIYIRKGAADFDSISFWLVGSKLKFWARLDNVNEIHCAPWLK